MFATIFASNRNIPDVCVCVSVYVLFVFTLSRARSEVSDLIDDVRFMALLKPKCPLLCTLLISATCAPVDATICNKLVATKTEKKVLHGVSCALAQPLHKLN